MFTRALKIALVCSTSLSNLAHSVLPGATTPADITASSPAQATSMTSNAQTDSLQPLQKLFNPHSALKKLAELSLSTLPGVSNPLNALAKAILGLIKIRLEKDLNHASRGEIVGCLGDEYTLMGQHIQLISKLLEPFQQFEREAAALNEQLSALTPPPQHSGDTATTTSNGGALATNSPMLEVLTSWKNCALKLPIIELGDLSSEIDTFARTITTANTKGAEDPMQVARALLIKLSKTLEGLPKVPSLTLQGTQTTKDSEGFDVDVFFACTTLPQALSYFAPHAGRVSRNGPSFLPKISQVALTEFPKEAASTLKIQAVLVEILFQGYQLVQPYKETSEGILLQSFISAFIYYFSPKFTDMVNSLKGTTKDSEDLTLSLLTSILSQLSIAALNVPEDKTHPYLTLPSAPKSVQALMNTEHFTVSQMQALVKEMLQNRLADFQSWTSLQRGEQECLTLRGTLYTQAESRTGKVKAFQGKIKAIHEAASNPQHALQAFTDSFTSPLDAACNQINSVFESRTGHLKHSFFDSYESFEKKCEGQKTLLTSLGDQASALLKGLVQDGLQAFKNPSPLQADTQTPLQADTQTPLQADTQIHTLIRAIKNSDAALEALTTQDLSTLKTSFGTAQNDLQARLDTLLELGIKLTDPTLQAHLRSLHTELTEIKESLASQASVLESLTEAIQVTVYASDINFLKHLNDACLVLEAELQAWVPLQSLSGVAIAEKLGRHGDYEALKSALNELLPHLLPTGATTPNLQGKFLKALENELTTRTQTLTSNSPLSVLNTALGQMSALTAEAKEVLTLRNLGTLTKGDSPQDISPSLKESFNPLVSLFQKASASTNQLYEGIQYLLKNPFSIDVKEILKKLLAEFWSKYSQRIANGKGKEQLALTHLKYKNELFEKKLTSAKETLGQKLGTYHQRVESLLTKLSDLHDSQAMAKSNIHNIQSEVLRDTEVRLVTKDPIAQKCQQVVQFLALQGPESKQAEAQRVSEELAQEEAQTINDAVGRLQNLIAQLDEGRQAILKQMLEELQSNKTREERLSTLKKAYEALMSLEGADLALPDIALIQPLLDFEESLALAISQFANNALTHMSNTFHATASEDFISRLSLEDVELEGVLNNAFTQTQEAITKLMDNPALFEPIEAALARAEAARQAEEEAARIAAEEEATRAEEAARKAEEEAAQIAAEEEATRAEEAARQAAAVENTPAAQMGTSSQIVDPTTTSQDLSWQASMGNTLTARNNNSEKILRAFIAIVAMLLTFYYNGSHLDNK